MPFRFSFLLILDDFHHLPVICLKDSTRKRNFTSLKLFNVALDIDISTNCIILVTTGVKQKSTWIFVGTIYTFLDLFVLSKAKQ